ncbi:helix-turn-helix transcriptional regulator [Laspinema sp. D1]|uniref:Helix-turn-helix transcriptional regulator n=1 Tax=Laspinema palackyanum D2a TaxID=2953684 RepID=A0ABT2MLU8_9CYAN|nr:helix-turn-helix transcriptional regulator [Laspinema sp. D2a]
MVTLRIQELAEAKGITLEQLSEDCCISVEKLQKYASESIEIQEETAADIQAMATQLNVTVFEVLKPVDHPVAFKLKIQEIAYKKGITLEELSEKSGVHFAIILFYSTQAIAKAQFEKKEFQESLSRISQVLGGRSEDLKVSAELPLTSLRLKEGAQEKGITLKQLSEITQVPYELIELMDNQPINISMLSLDSVICQILGSCVK